MAHRRISPGPAPDQGVLPDSEYARRNTPMAKSVMNGSGAKVMLDHAFTITRCDPIKTGG